MVNDRARDFVECHNGIVKELPASFPRWNENKTLKDLCLENYVL